MRARPSLLAVAVLCAFAFGAATASAEQRAYGCSTAAEVKEFSDEHCQVKGGGSSTRGHVLLTGTEKISVDNKKIEGSTTEPSTSILKGVVAGVVFEARCPEVKGSGSLTNGANSVSGELSLTYSKCMIVRPPERNCIIKEAGVTEEAVITTEPLKVTTVGQAAGKLKIQPAGGTTLAKIPIEGCIAEGPPKGTYLLTGSLTFTAFGARYSTTEKAVTTEGALNLDSKPAGIEGALTFSTSGGVPVALT